MKPVVFCSFQPCPRQAEGDMTITYISNGQEYTKVFAVCPRHYEYINQNDMSHYSIGGQDIVFSDEVSREVVDLAAHHGAKIV